MVQRQGSRSLWNPLLSLLHRPASRVLLGLGLLLELCLFAACSHVRRPPPATHDGLHGAHRLLVMPAALEDPARFHRAVAGSLLLSYALKTQRPALHVLDLADLMARAGTSSTCLSTPASLASCIPSYAGATWLEVSPQEALLELRWHKNIPGAPTVVGVVDPALPLETLGPQLMGMLELRLAPPAQNADPGLASETGVCLQREQLEPLGALLLPLLRGHRDTPLPDDPPLEPPDRLPQPLHGPELASLRSRPELSAQAFRSAFLEVWLEVTIGLEHGAAAQLEALPAPGDRSCGWTLLQTQRGKAQLELGQAADEALGQAAFAQPFDADAQALWAAALIGVGREDDALLALRRALNLEPERLLFRRRLADLLSGRGRLEDARSLLIEGRNFHPAGLPRAWLEHDLGSIAELESAWQLARMHFQMGLQAVEGHSAPATEGALYHGLGMAFVGLQDPLRAERAFASAAAARRRLPHVAGSDPGRRLANSLYNQGVQLAHLERWEDARRLLLEAAALYGGEEGERTRLDYPRLLQDAGLHRESQDVMNTLVQAEPPQSARATADLAFLSGVNLSHLEALPEAMLALERAALAYEILQEPLLEGQSWYNLARVAELAEDLPRAIDAYSRARALALKMGDMDSVLEIEARLRMLRARVPQR